VQPATLCYKRAMRQCPSSLIWLLMFAVIGFNVYLLRRPAKVEPSGTEVGALGDPAALTPRKRALIARMVLEWQDAEHGGPFVVGLLDLEGALTPLEVGPPADVLPAELVEAMAALPTLLQRAQLDPGPYAYACALEADALAGQPFLQDGRTQVEGRHIRIEVTRKHLALIRAANLSVRQLGLSPWAGVDVAAPYGEGEHYAVMARILGPSTDGNSAAPSEAERHALDALHASVLPAMQVFLQRASMP
jgi:hypothetical protein